LEDACDEDIPDGQSGEAKGQHYHSGIRGSADQISHLAATENIRAEKLFDGLLAPSTGRDDWPPVFEAALFMSPPFSTTAMLLSGPPQSLRYGRVLEVRLYSHRRLGGSRIAARFWRADTVKINI
jgi:hypothetical protein